MRRLDHRNRGCRFVSNSIAHPGCLQCVCCTTNPACNPNPLLLQTNWDSFQAWARLHNKPYLRDAKVGSSRGVRFD